MSALSPSQLFNSSNPIEVAERFETFKDELNKSLASPRPLAPAGSPDAVRAELGEQLRKASISKAISSSALDSIAGQLDLNKSDFSLTSPIATGLVAYDLAGPARVLAPRPTPLRNRIARRKGQGNAHEFMRITGFTGSGTGGLGLIRPGITETTQNTFGGISYLRGPKIEYAGDHITVPYKQFSMSTQTSFAAAFASLGFDDARQLASTSLLYASMLAEERMMLGGRGTSSGFAGTLAAPTGISVAARSAAAGETGLSGVTTNVYVKVTAEAVWGESVLSSAANVAATNGQVVDVTVTGVPAGATGLRVYISTGASDPGDASRWFALRAGSNVITVQGALPTSGTAASTVTADSSANANDYDGLLTTCTGSSTGYLKRLNTTLNASNPGAEFFEAFAAMYESVKADPDEVLANGRDRKQLSDLLKTSSSSSYQIQIANAQGTDSVHDAKIGAAVTGLQNEVTGKMVNLTVHPWLPQGNMPIISWALPIPDSNVSECFAVYNVVDQTMYEWPVTQLAYECSSYWYGSLICEAPAWQGAITGIKLA